MLRRGIDWLRVIRQLSSYELITRVIDAARGLSGGPKPALFRPALAVELPPGPILVFAPHADDETLGPGATLVRAVRAGRQVQVVVLTDGAQGSENPVECGPTLVATREAEAALAMRELELPAPRFLRFPDLGLTERSDALTEAMAALLQELAPQSVFAPFPLDYHPDHIATTKALDRALHQMRWNGEVWLYECSAPIFPNTIVDVGETIDRKEAAMRCYVSQMAANDYVSTIVRGLNRFRSYGLLRGGSYAEGFFRTDRHGLRRLTAARS